MRTSCVNCLSFVPCGAVSDIMDMFAKHRKLWKTVWIQVGVEPYRETFPGTDRIYELVAEECSFFRPKEQGDQ